MENNKVKIFKDSVHGYIEIPSTIVSNIIDTEQFQRLRNIEQTSMRPLYPAARHDRFIHSLGVYYLGTLAFKGFKQNSERIINSLKDRSGLIIDGSILDDVWWRKQQLLFEIACLMHDCAHAPFSHTLEDYYNLKKNDKGIPILSTLLLDECVELGDSSFREDFFQKGSLNGVGAPHEKLSSYIVLHEYKEAINSVFSDLLPGVKLDDADYSFICRMIIGCRYQENNIELSIKNCIITLLNSSTIDVDGLDYIVRDSQMSGVSTFDIDYQRILNSFTILPVINYSRVECKNLNGIWLSDSRFDVRFFSGNVSGAFYCTNINNSQKDKFYPVNSNFTDGVCVYDDFMSKVKIDGLTKGAIILKSSSKISIDGEFNGTVSGKKIIGTHDDLKDQNITFVLGYEKRCLSVIQNTIDARNNEYLWIYTHPKVQYNSSYLQCGLLVEAAKFLCNQYNRKKDKFHYEDFITQIMGYKELFDKKDKALCEKLHKNNLYFFRSNDDDLNALFKKIYLQISEMENDSKYDEYKKLYNEYSSRKQRKVLWKSFMEKETYPDICIENGSDFSGIEYLLDEAREELDKRSKSYMHIQEDVQSIFEGYNVKNVLIVCTKAKTKRIDFSEFIVKYGERYVRLCDVFDDGMLTKSINKEIEYLYYDGQNIDPTLLAEIDKKLVEYYEIQ